MNTDETRMGRRLHLVRGANEVNTRGFGHEARHMADDGLTSTDDGDPLAFLETDDDLLTPAERHPTAPQPFQFSLATLLAVVTAYALLFGFLGWLKIHNGWLFVAVVTYFTAIAFGQRSFFDGRHPYGTSYLIGGTFGGIVTEILYLLDGTLTLGEAAFALPFAFLFNGVPGAMVGGLVDLTLLAIEVVTGNYRKVLVPWGDVYRAKLHGIKPRWSRKVRLAILAALGVLFVTTAVMANLTWR
jgi:hypothetical protein